MEKCVRCYCCKQFRACSWTDGDPTCSDCDEGSVVRIRRVSDKDSDFLVFLDQAGLRPGAVVTVASRSPYAGSLSVQPNDGEALPLGIDAARRVLVEPV